MADLHTHVIPGVDDGAPDLESAINTLRSMLADSVTAVAATPHLNASRTNGKRRRRSNQAWPELVERVERELPELKLFRGFEIRLDVPDPDLSDPELRLGGTRFALVEFHAFTIPESSVDALARIRDRGHVPIIVHPERYWGFDRGLSIVPRWKTAGALVQVNSGSLFGEYDDHIKVIAHRFLSEGWADLLASDNHARPGRSPSLRAAWDYLSAKGLREQATLLLATNPHRILRDEMPLSVPGIPPDLGFFGRLARAIRGDDED